MPLDANCPQCQHVFPVTEARKAILVECPGCETELTAEFRKRITAEPGQHPYELFVSPGRPVGAVPLPSSKKPRIGDDDEDEMLGGGGGMGIVVFAGVSALVLALSGLGATGYLLFTNLDTSDATINHLGSLPGPKGETGPRGSGGVIPKGGGTKPGGGFPVGDPSNPPRPKNTFSLQPVPGTVPAISPPGAIDEAAPQTILLPGKAGAIAVGGGGRYIVFHFPQEGRIGVFDANVGDLTTSEGIENGDAQLAAGANKLVVSVPRTRKYRVYSLPDLKQQNEFESPLFHGARAVAMGSKTNGPALFVDPFGHVVMVDLTTGKPVEGSDQEIHIPNGQLRASPDGKLFVAGNEYSGDDKFSMVDEFAARWRVRSPDISAAYPSADGNHVLGKAQIITTAGRSIAGKGTATGGVWYVPALTATGEFFLKVDEMKLGQPPREKRVVSIAVHRGFKNVEKPVLTPWVGLPECEGFFDVFGRPLAYDRHLFLIPEAKLLVIVNNEKTKIVVRKLAI